jgi:formate hydrogenlyase subunit 3/multisubunit Na+/H+ antiporter MnhD subunit
VITTAAAETMPAAVHVPPAGSRRRVAAWSAGLATVTVGAGGAVLGLLAVLGHVHSVRIDWLVPLLGVELAFDPLGGFFLVVTGAVAVAVGIYAIGYLQHEPKPSVVYVMLPAFVGSMLIVPAAGSITTFLLGWEAMALTSLVLVLSDHRRPQVRAAALMYAAITQLGFLALLVGLLIWSASSGGADTFAALAANSHIAPPGTRALVTVLTLVGFGSKCGLLPLHAWLPRAHPEAPSPVSALMSAAMVNLGVYGLLRFDLQLLGPGSRWFGILLIIIGALSALYGVLQASLATDLKRLLAYSTIENLGLIVLAVGAGVLLRASGLPALAAVALVAALLHVLAHAAFKTLAFLAAGSVLAGSGLRDLDDMGGLVHRMPATTAFFGVAALGACGLPLGAGFVSEWLMIQSLVHAPRAAGSALALTLPPAVAAVALCTGLAVAAMVKAFGVGFLARPRSDAAAGAREASAPMLVGMGLAAAACVLLALTPVVTGPLLHRALQPLAGASAAGEVRLGVVLRLPGTAGSISPLWLSAGLIIATAVALAVAAFRRSPQEVSRPLWACGADTVSARMQYTATSFAEPLQRVFDDVLQPETDIEITHHAESRYLVDRVAFRVRIGDAVEERLYRPVLAAVRGFASVVRRVHTGSVHLYLAYGGIGLLVVVLVAR